MKNSKESQNRIVVGVAWYRPAQWERIREISADADDLEETYEEWLNSAEQNLKEIKVPGLHLLKVDIDSEQLIAWCNLRGLELNAEARSQYVAEKVREIDRSGGSGQPERNLTKPCS
jgi:hypothetical protein